VGKLEEISNFFFRYKELEKKEVQIIGWGDKKEAEEILKNCQNLYNKYYELVKKGAEGKRKLVEMLKVEENQ
jgi:hypothetical protein